jgi:hypothetical protein
VRYYTIVTELGSEKKCISCGEYWPADIEFFEARVATRDRLATRCIACAKEKIWGAGALDTRRLAFAYD